MASMVQKTLEEKRLESRIEKLREKQDDLEEKARESKKRICLLYTSPSPRDGLLSRMPSSA